MPTSNETRVRNEALVKMQATDLPSNGLGAISFFFILAHRSNISATSAAVRSVIWQSERGIFSSWFKQVFAFQIFRV